MTLKKRWVGKCDEPGCGAVEIIELEPGGIGPEKWDAGEALNNRGWFARPGDPLTYCEKHAGKHWPTETDDEV